MKQTWRWRSPQLQRDIALVRWGHYGAPVLMFPTAGGDAEEIERFGVVDATSPLLGAGRVKLYSLDSLAGQAWLDESVPPARAGRTQNRFLACVFDEVVPAIRRDCDSADIEIAAAGASLGAFNAIAALCGRPDLFRLAIAMSGTYDMTRFTRGHFDDDLYFASPLHYLPNLGESFQLDRLRRRFALLAFAGGRWEDPGETWRMANTLGAKRIPNRVDPWGAEYDHDWPTWRAMLPRYLDELID